MDATLNYLNSVLQNELKHLNTIFDFLKQKEMALIKNDSEQIKQMALREHSLFVKSKDLEISRLSIMEIVAKRFNLPSKQSSLSMVIERVDAEYRQLFMKMHQLLREIVDKIRHQNKKCEMLLRKSIELVKHNIGLIRGNFKYKTKMVYNKNRVPEEKYYSNTLVDKRG